MMRLALILIPLLLEAAPAHAMFIGTAISAIAGAIGVSYAAVAVVGRLVLSAAVSAYQKRRMKKKMAAQRQSGITTQFVGTGGTTPLTVIVGRYATDGHLEAPQMSHTALGRPNGILTYVIGLGDMPGIVPTGRVVINDRWYFITAEESSVLPGYGFMTDGDLAGYAMFRFRSGFETTADAWLLSTYGSYAERPWQSDMIGRGIPQAIVNLFRDPERFPGEPRLRFELLGIPLYDPRFDSSIGGSGPQRWLDRATWTHTDNPKVIEYNIHRGIAIDGFGIWGNRARAEELPIDNWFAAMNACDVLIDNGSGGTEKTYVFGFEWGLDTEPREIIDEINRSCGGETVEVGGIWKTRVGGIGLPVYFMTDRDILVTRPQEMDPFPGLESTFNAVSASFPDPSILWEAREAPPLTNEAWDVEDGLLEYDDALAGWVRQPRRLLREVSFPAVPNLRQVQRLISAMVRESRKRVSHVLTLPPAALALEPLDAVAWTSARNGYVDKIFDVVLTADPVTTLRPRIGLLEADPADHAAPTYVPLPDVSTLNPAFAARTVIGFAVAPYALADASGVARRPGLRCTWDGAAMANVRGIAIDVRVKATEQIVAQTSVQRASEGAVVIGGLLQSTEYQVRALPDSDHATVWTAWLDVTTGSESLGGDDFGPDAITFVDVRIDQDPLSAPWLLTAAEPSESINAAALATALPVTVGRIVVELTLEMTAAAPRWLRVQIMAVGAPKDGQLLSTLILLVPGADYRVLSQDTPGLTTTALGATTLSVEAFGLLVDEEIEVSGVRVTRQAWRI